MTERHTDGHGDMHRIAFESGMTLEEADSRRDEITNLISDALGIAESDVVIEAIVAKRPEQD